MIKSRLDESNQSDTGFDLNSFLSFNEKGNNNTTQMPVTISESEMQIVLCPHTTSKNLPKKYFPKIYQKMRVAFTIKPFDIQKV